MFDRRIVTMVNPAILPALPYCQAAQHVRLSESQPWKSCPTSLASTMTKTKPCRWMTYRRILPVLKNNMTSGILPQALNTGRTNGWEVRCLSTCMLITRLHGWNLLVIHWFVDNGSLTLKGIDLDKGRPRVKFGTPQKVFRFSTVRQAANFYLMYARRKDADTMAMTQSLRREYEKIKRDGREGGFAYTNKTFDLT